MVMDQGMYGLLPGRSGCGLSSIRVRTCPLILNALLRKVYKRYLPLPCKHVDHCPLCRLLGWGWMASTSASSRRCTTWLMSQGHFASTASTTRTSILHGMLAFR